MNPLVIIRQFVKGLVKDNEPYQIALALSFGFMLGIMPKNNLTAQFIFLIMMCSKANIPFAFGFTLFFTALAPFIDKITDPIGYSILNYGSFTPFFTSLYNMPIAPWTDFNNTVVLGSLILSIFLFYPIYLIGKRFGVFYNDKFRAKLANSKLIKSLKASWLFDWYFRN